ncbi:MAG: hypothetical protein AAF614_21560 [Chloroflexota bacterium]
MADIAAAGLFSALSRPCCHEEGETGGRNGRLLGKIDARLSCPYQIIWQNEKYKQQTAVMARSRKRVAQSRRLDYPTNHLNLIID